MRKSIFLILTLCGFIHNELHSQLENFNYPYANIIILPDTSSRLKTLNLSRPPVHLNARSIGMGKTQISYEKNKLNFNSNPAFLATKKRQTDLINIEAAVPRRTLNLVDYVYSNKEIFQYNLDIEIQTIIDSYLDGSITGLTSEYINILKKYTQFSADIIKMTDGIIYNPQIHGFAAFPDLKIQYDNFGFSLSTNNLNSYIILPGNILKAVSLLNENIEKSNAYDWIIITDLLQSSISNEGNISAEALPRIISLNSIDISTNLGYGFMINPKLHAGINLKYINRRFSSKLLSVDDIDKIILTNLGDYPDVINTVSMDIGALYNEKNSGFKFAASAYNIIPVKKYHTEIEYETLKTTTHIPDDDVKDILLSNDINQIPQLLYADTLIISKRQTVKKTLPVNTNMPFILNIGVTRPLGNFFRIEAEIADLTANNSLLYNNYRDRFRLGFEFSTKYDILSIRTGVANSLPTFGIGLGINAKRVKFNINYGSAFSEYYNSFTHFVDLQIGFDYAPAKKSILLSSY